MIMLASNSKYWVGSGWVTQNGPMDNSELDWKLAAASSPSRTAGGPRGRATTPPQTDHIKSRSVIAPTRGAALTGQALRRPYRAAGGRGERARPSPRRRRPSRRRRRRAGGQSPRRRRL